MENFFLFPELSIQLLHPNIRNIMTEHWRPNTLEGKFILQIKGGSSVYTFDRDKKYTQNMSRKT
jgi:hypothetical protein